MASKEANSVPDYSELSLERLAGIIHRRFGFLARKSKYNFKRVFTETNPSKYFDQKVMETKTKSLAYLMLFFSNLNFLAFYI